jgi:hypothetical protein
MRNTRVFDGQLPRSFSRQRTNIFRNFFRRGTTREQELSNELSEKFLRRVFDTLLGMGDITLFFGLEKSNLPEPYYQTATAVW